MARKPRIFFPGAFYHVISRGNNKQKIFLENKNFEVFLSKLKLCHEEDGFMLYAYVLMPNHFHLLIESGDVPLSKTMQRLLLTYTQYFNRKYNKIGHLFQGRYKAILCDKDSYLLELVRYIHLNPVRAKLAPRPADYKWSSYNSYIEERAEPYINTSFVLSLFGKKSSARIETFKSFVDEGISMGNREDLYKTVDQRILGDDDFTEEILSKQSELIDKKISTTVIEDAVFKILKVTFTDLPLPPHSSSRAMAWIGYFAKHYGLDNQTVIAKRYGVLPSALSMAVSRLSIKIKTDKETQEFKESILKLIL